MDSRRFGRTAKGHAEIAQGSKAVRGKLRTVLFLIDPGKPVEKIHEQMRLISAPLDAIEQLVAGGYAAEIGKPGAPLPEGIVGIDDVVANFRIAKAFMNETIVDALGIRAFFFTLKLERCVTAEDLIALVPEYAEALIRKMDRESVRALVERARELLIAARG